jgi:hypothetical protein
MLERRIAFMMTGRPTLSLHESLLSTLRCPPTPSETARSSIPRGAMLWPEIGITDIPEVNKAVRPSPGDTMKMLGNWRAARTTVGVRIGRPGPHRIAASRV